MRVGQHGGGWAGQHGVGGGGVGQHGGGWGGWGRGRAA